MTYLRTIANLIGASLVIAATFTNVAAFAEGPNDDTYRYPLSQTETREQKLVELSAVPEQSERSRPTEVTVSGGTVEQLEIAAWSLQRFEAAGLPVPAVDIHLHQDLADCGDNRGTYNADSQRIDVCVNERNVVLHEIAHAWNHENLSEAQRSEYVSVGGFGSWNDPETPWFDKGSEDAADTIAWALLEEPVSMFSPSGPIARRSAAYWLLTGSHAPRIREPIGNSAG